MNIIERMKAPTPKFFRVLRTVGFALAAAGAAVVAAPIALPTVVVTVAGYLTVAGGVLTAVSQTAVMEEPDENSEEYVDTE
jgi:uncharacterized membrane protein HdeD (DUF308 family)